FEDEKNHDKNELSFLDIIIGRIPNSLYNTISSQTQNKREVFKIFEETM
ncbi:5589_t:CDS:1, partial [Diversispora eburnea]